MSLEKGFSWSYKNYDFKGFSIAGQTTSLVYNNAKICFDIAQALPFNMNAKLYCLTHLHADHGAGLNYLLSQRSLFRLPPAKIMLPKSNIESVELILREWMKIEGFTYQYELIGVDHNLTYDFDKTHIVRAFKTTHRVNSFGYIIYQKKKKLKDQYKDLQRQELLNLKSKQTQIEEDVLKPIICFTGDTQVEFLKSHTDVLKAEVLFMECTYIDNKKSIDETRKWGHIHLDEILEFQELFNNDHISFIHLSARYNTNQAIKVFKEKLKPSFFEKVSLFPRPF